MRADGAVCVWASSTEHLPLFWPAALNANGKHHLRVCAGVNRSHPSGEASWPANRHCLVKGSPSCLAAEQKLCFFASPGDADRAALAALCGHALPQARRVRRRPRGQRGGGGAGGGRRLRLAHRLPARGLARAGAPLSARLCTPTPHGGREARNGRRAPIPLL